jgi:hypothetical protein
MKSDQYNCASHKTGFRIGSKTLGVKSHPKEITTVKDVVISLGIGVSQD